MTKYRFTKHKYLNDIFSNSDINHPKPLVNIALHKFPNSTIVAITRTAGEKDNLKLKLKILKLILIDVEVDPVMYDLKGSYTVAKLWMVSLECRNIFNFVPPSSLSPLRRYTSLATLGSLSSWLIYP